MNQAVEPEDVHGDFVYIPDEEWEMAKMGMGNGSSLDRPNMHSFNYFKCLCMNVLLME